jgi:hypothetical protein
MWLATKGYTHFGRGPVHSAQKYRQRFGFIKGRRCRAMQMKNRTVVFQFKNGEAMSLTEISMEKTSSGMKFIGRQLLWRLIFAETVHRSQGMALE